VNWKASLVIEYPETIHIVYVPSEQITGTVSNMGVYASMVSYTIDDVEYEELMNNEDFIVVDEITLIHFEEEDNG
jgi:hypothetical protein